MVKMKMLEYPALYPKNGHSTYHYIMQHQEVMEPSTVDEFSTYGKPVNEITENNISLKDGGETGSNANLDIMDVTYNTTYNGQDMHVVDITVRQDGYLDRTSGLLWMQAETADEWCRQTSSIANIYVEGVSCESTTDSGMRSLYDTNKEYSLFPTSFKPEKSVNAGKIYMIISVPGVIQESDIDI